MTNRANQPDTPADVALRACLNAQPPQSFIMVAGAGSGKTTSLIKALDTIVGTHGEKMKRRRQKAACITYTEIAAEEIWADVGKNPLVHVSTIHSFMWALMRPLQTDIIAWVAARTEERITELQEAEAGFGPRVQQRTRDKNAQDQLRYIAHRDAITSVPSFTYGTGSDYPKGILGHDDVIRMSSQLLQERPLLRTLLAQQFPFIFVDESQDTAPVIVEALRQVEVQMRGSFCLGFFGDPMQQIYPTGIGEIIADPTWTEITKPENFRCPTKVLEVANAIRHPGDGLAQTRGRMIAAADGQLQPVPGTARIFILPINAQRIEQLQRVRQWMAHTNNDPDWLPNAVDNKVKMLVVVHRMAAARLGFASLYAAMNDGAPSSFKDGFLDGTSWPLRPFLSFILPIVEAAQAGRDFEVMELLRKHSPQLHRTALGRDVNIAERLAQIQAAVDALVAVQRSGANATVSDVLKVAREHRLLELDPRILGYLDLTDAAAAAPVAAEEEDDADPGKEVTSMDSYFACPAREFWGFRNYLLNESPYSTQQGIKGAEFERVLTVLDDDEGTHNQFSYDKYFGITPLSARDNANIAAGKETAIERTRRLFYVSCTRALKDLVVVYFTDNVAVARAQIEASGIFANAEIREQSALNELQPA